MNNNGMASKNVSSNGVNSNGVNSNNVSSNDGNSTISVLSNSGASNTATLTFQDKVEEGIQRTHNSLVVLDLNSQTMEGGNDRINETQKFSSMYIASLIMEIATLKNKLEISEAKIVSYENDKKT